MSQQRTRYTGPLNLTNIEAESTPPQRQGVDLSQYVAALQDSYNAWKAGDDDSARGTTIPRAAVTLATSRFRMAARELGIGVSFQVIEPTDARAAQYGLTMDQARLIFQARDKKAAPGVKAAAKPATAPAKSALPTPNKKG